MDKMLDVAAELNKLAGLLNGTIGALSASKTQLSEDEWEKLSDLSTSILLDADWLNRQALTLWDYEVRFTAIKSNERIKAHEKSINEIIDKAFQDD